MQVLFLEQQDGKIFVLVQILDESCLLEGDVMVDVYWLSLNYKDVLVIIGKGKIICNFLMISGIDFVGIVCISEDLCFYVGQEVLFIGWGVGENYWGGLVEQV